MSDITTLWSAARLPIEDGLYFADGRSYAVEADERGLRLVEAFDLGELLTEDPEWLTSIDITKEIHVPGGYACAGEGSHGSEGFFARLDEDHSLIWVCYLSESNPFGELSVEASTLTATSTSGLSITLPLDDPDKALPDQH
ncbi:hypothetical protein [Saccharothrix algeriensis]|uniref:Uncharacterized protein n=2 Tax=Saccharothrix algeriensis TaxID=173560 RepID=A0ABS2S2Q2_9PSEU|nr:hypothetical protein [Saccharothrix algeriensis]MBM7810516.1 hypothetical protein [Saccharothrix algeriensis]